MASEEIVAKFKKLQQVKHLMNDWESHPKGLKGPDDQGGFMEGMETAIQKKWKTEGGRDNTVNKLYNTYILGKNTKQEQPAKRDENSFVVGNIGAMKSNEGWRIKMDGTVIGQPVIREHAHVIADWLNNAFDSIKAYFKRTPDEDIEEL